MGFTDLLQLRNDFDDDSFEYRRSLVHDCGQLKAVAEQIQRAGAASAGCFDVLARAPRADCAEHNDCFMQLKALVTNAEEFYIPLSHLPKRFVRFQQGDGSESKIYTDERALTILKLMDFSVNSKTPLNYLIFRIYLHNILFPLTEYKLQGFMLDEQTRTFRFLVTQPFIKGICSTDDEVSECMTKMGFDKSERGYWEHKGIIVADVNKFNAITFNQQVYVFDEVITFDKTATK